MRTDATDDATQEHGPGFGLAVLLSVISGAGVALQSRANGELRTVVGSPIQAAVISFGVGLVLLLVLSALLPVVRRGVRAVLVAVRQGGGLRPWQTMGGLIGALLVVVQAYAVPQIGVALFTVALVAGQTGNALLVDRLGLGPGGRAPVGAGRVAAAVLAVVGVAIAVSGRLGTAGFVLLPVVLSVLIGGGSAVQQAINGRVNRVSEHVLATTVINFLWGMSLLLLIAGVLAVRGQGFHSVAGAPWWAWVGGPLGVFFIAVGAWAVHHLGVLVFGLSTLLGNIGTAVALDLLNPAHRDQLGVASVVGILVTFAAAALAAVATRREAAATQRRG